MHPAPIGSPLLSGEVFFMEEIWKDVTGFEGLYQVSTYGNVRSCDRIVFPCGNNLSMKLKGRLLAPGENKKGYYHVNLSKNGKTKCFRIHRLVAEHFIENKNILPEVNHIDEIKSHNNYKNLEWSSHINNIRHGTGINRSAKSRIGTQNTFGERTGSSKLKEYQVIEILNSKKLLTELSEIYGVGISCLSNIKNKKSWKHLTFKQ